MARRFPATLVELIIYNSVILRNNRAMTSSKTLLSTLLVSVAGVASSYAAGSIWKLGDVGTPWTEPLNGVSFVQEGNVNDLPGDPNSPAVNQEADDDYYFAGTYPSPIDAVATSEIAVERAFAGADNSLRMHFNLDGSAYNADTLAVFSFSPFNFHVDGQDDPRYGVQIEFNGNEILPETVFRPADIGLATTSPFTLGSVGAIFSEGGDNVVELTGVNFNGDGGGNWMGINSHELSEVDAIPEPSSVTLLLAGAVLLLMPFNRRRKARA